VRFACFYPVAQGCVPAISCAIAPHPNSRAIARRAPNACFSTHAAIGKSIFFSNPAPRVPRPCAVLFRGVAVFRQNHCSYCFANRGNFSRTKGRNCFATKAHQEQHAGEKPLRPGFLAPLLQRLLAPHRDPRFGVSAETPETPTASPASRNCLTAASRKFGCGARGSSHRASLGRRSTGISSPGPSAPRCVSARRCRAQCGSIS